MKNTLIRILSILLGNILYPLARLYWFIFRPTTYGVKMIIENKHNILLIRNTYGNSNWTFPGGGVKSGETNEEAAKREVAEEVGLHLESTTYIDTIVFTHEYKHDHVAIYTAAANTRSFTVDPVEIREAQWFSRSSLPQLTPTAEKMWKTYQEKTV